jgi:DNA polymerase (family 10)
LTEPLAQIAVDPDRELSDLPGIGTDLAGKIGVILETGDLPLRAELALQVPAGLRDLILLPGLGPKRARLLYDNLDICSLDGLRAACLEQRVRTLRGFGVKTEQTLLHSLDELGQTSRRMYLSEAAVYAGALLRHFSSAPGLQEIAVAGSFRRCRETVGDLDILVACTNPAAVMERLASYEGLARVLARGPTKMSVRLSCGLQVDVRVVESAAYGAALVYFTGSKAHNIALRKRAQERGLKISEYGVFRGQRRIAGRTEDDVYKSVGLPWIPPELREDHGELDLAEAGELPKLIDPKQVHGDLHMHTTATDGRNTLEEMVEAARHHGYAYIAITDHSKRVTMARGLDARRLRQHWRSIDRLQARTRSIHILKGVELDILENGKLDLSDDVLAEADWVIASIHYGQNQPAEQITRRLLNAVRHPCVNAIGHPTGRLIGRRPGYKFDHETVFREAAEHGCLMEVNGQPSRLDLDDQMLRSARKFGVGIYLGTDAHAVEELCFMQGAVNQARRAGLEAAEVVNTRNWARFSKLLQKRLVER